MMWVFSVMWCGVGWCEAPVVHHLGFHFHSFPLQGEGEVETCISVELSSTPADASSCLRPDHGDTPITSQTPQNSHGPHIKLRNSSELGRHITQTEG